MLAEFGVVSEFMVGDGLLKPVQTLIIQIFQASKRLSKAQYLVKVAQEIIISVYL